MNARIALSLIAALVIAAGPSAAAAADHVRPPLLTVTGDGSVRHAADRAIVAFRIETIDALAVRAVGGNAAAADALTAAVAKLALERTSVATTAYNVSYNPRPARPNPDFPERYGYVVERTFAVTTDRPEAAGAIVDAGIAAGATAVNGVSFTLRDPDAAFREAQQAAVGDAIRQARGLAAAAHLRLVRIIEVATPGAAAPVQPGPQLRMSAALAAAPTTIDPGDLTARARVTLRYETAPASGG